MSVQEGASTKTCAAKAPKREARREEDGESAGFEYLIGLPSRLASRIRPFAARFLGGA